MDVSRHFYKVDSLKKIMGYMADCKLNILHLHVSDSQSWPVYIEAYPEFTEVGAYSSEKIYSRDDIRDLATYA